MASACLPLSMVLQICDILILDEISEVESRDDVNSSVQRKAQAFLRAIQATLAAVLTVSAHSSVQGCEYNMGVATRRSDQAAKTSYYLCGNLTSNDGILAPLTGLPNQAAEAVARGKACAAADPPVGHDIHGFRGGIEARQHVAAVREPRQPKHKDCSEALLVDCDL